LAAGLSSRTRWGSYSAPPDTPAVTRGWGDRKRKGLGVGNREGGEGDEEGVGGEEGTGGRGKDRRGERNGKREGEVGRNFSP